MITIETKHEGRFLTTKTVKTNKMMVPYEYVTRKILNLAKRML